MRLCFGYFCGRRGASIALLVAVIIVDLRTATASGSGCGGEGSNGTLPAARLGYEDRDTFAEYVPVFNRKYPTAEAKSKAQKAYAQHLNMVSQHNAVCNATYAMEPNEFSDQHLSQVRLQTALTAASPFDRQHTPLNTEPCDPCGQNTSPVSTSNDALAFAHADNEP